MASWSRLDRFAVLHYGMQALRAFSAVHSAAKQSWSSQISLPARRAGKKKETFSKKVENKENKEGKMLSLASTVRGLRPRIVLGKALLLRCTR